MNSRFESQFSSLTNSLPFPWQRAWYELLLAEQYDQLASCNIPTGLGKTSVLALWLIAREQNVRIPRRLVYVVNRRTVVDQTTEEAKKLLKNAAAAGLQAPAISTLRGQYADNREWSADPSRPAIICGTVDMIGSRLLFSGYGVGFKTRPLHAGFLGQDVLLVHDEAHLEPAFQQLVESIQEEQKRCNELLKFHVVELTATSRAGGEPFTLTADDAADERVQKRFQAQKKLRLHPLKDNRKLAEQIASLALDHKDSQQMVLIFVQAVADVAKVQDMLLKNKVSRERIETLTGTLRGMERDALVEKPLFQRFMKPPESPEVTEYLICTSAGEVGVNISAQQLVTDLTTYESMAQRFGRVNRFGDSPGANIDVVHPTEFDEKKEIDVRRRKTLVLLTQLKANASPQSLAQLSPTERQAAFAPPPEIPRATDFLFDTWALTSIREQLPGRPLVVPYLHGRSEFEPPETHVAWRQEVGVLQRLSLEAEPLARLAEDLLEDYPLKSIELLRDRSDRIFTTLKKLSAPATTPIWLQTDDGEIEVTTLGEILNQTKEDLENLTLILPPEAGGLESGLFTGAAFDPLRDDYDIADQWKVDGKPMRQRIWEDQKKPDEGTKLERTIQFFKEDETAVPETWYWYVRMPEAPSARSRENYALQAHLDDAAELAQRIVAGLQLPEDLKRAVVVAAMFHDLGKRRKLWQQSIGNRHYPAEQWAKSAQTIATMERTRYRHEFGSLKDIADRTEFASLAPELQQLVLHLVGAHHGRARPHFDVDEAFDLEGDEAAARQRAGQVAIRFAQLQRKYGRWGLAYLESLVRAADILASRKAEEVKQ